MNLEHAEHILKFEEWLNHRSMDGSWITVAQDAVSKHDGWETCHFTTSILAPSGSDKTLLDDHIWPADDHFGNVEAGRDGVRVEMETHIGNNNDVKIEPFTLLRFWHGTWPDRFELIQNFILFYNLRLDAAGNTYMAVDYAGEVTDVVRIESEGECKRIEIQAKYLRNYLACRNMVLVRQHEHWVSGDETLAELGIKSTERNLTDPDHAFRLTINDAGLSKVAGSELIGKDLIRPFAKCQDLLRLRKGNTEFITGVDENGADILESCASDGSNYLAPAFFERDVLKKYHDSEMYDVESDRIVCGSYWGMPFDTNKADLVQVYLGDLAKLPAKEQLHWREHNAYPDGGITENRIARDIRGLFVEPDGVEHRFEASLNSIQERFEGQFGFKLFKPLLEDDAHREHIRVPLNDSRGEFEEQIIKLAIRLPDSIDETKLREHMGSKHEELERIEAERAARKEKTGSIDVLEAFLLGEGLDTTIVCHLRKIQRVRSSVAAHRKSRDYMKYLEKYGLEQTNRKKFVQELLLDLSRSFDGLRVGG